jgi:predicted secreted protein
MIFILKAFNRIPIIRNKGSSMILRKIILIISLILFICASVWAGDVASFIDMGFSPDGKIYMFGQYGVFSPALKPWAELYVVDVPANNFVPNGRVSFTQDGPIKAGQDGSGVFYNLVANNSALTGRYNVNFQNQGLPLYISRNEKPPSNGEIIDFRDFLAGKAYKAELIPYREGSGQNVRSWFYINLESKAQNGQIKSYTIGNPQIKRQKIETYNINRVLIDSHGESIIFIIEMKRVSESGYDIRYMVEVQRL